MGANVPSVFRGGQNHKESVVSPTSLFSMPCIPKEMTSDVLSGLIFVGISGGCASMRKAPDLRIQGTFHIFIVLQDILALSPFIL